MHHYTTLRLKPLHHQPCVSVFLPHDFASAVRCTGILVIHFAADNFSFYMTELLEKQGRDLPGEN